MKVGLLPGLLTLTDSVKPWEAHMLTLTPSLGRLFFGVDLIDGFTLIEREARNAKDEEKVLCVMMLLRGGAAW